VQHLAVGFHPARRAPGAGKQGELAARRRHYLLDKRNAELLIVLYAESFQGRILVCHVGVAIARKVAAVNIGAGQRIANAGRGAIVSLKKLLLLRLRQLGKGFGRGVGERPANAEHGLKAVAGVDEYAHLGLDGLSGGLKREVLAGCEALSSAGHRSVHAGRFAGRRIGTSRHGLTGRKLSGFLGGGAAQAQGRE